MSQIISVDNFQLFFEKLRLSAPNFQAHDIGRCATVRKRRLTQVRSRLLLVLEHTWQTPSGISRQRGQYNAAF